jgi:hypothetical protein
LEHTRFFPALSKKDLIILSVGIGGGSGSNVHGVGHGKSRSCPWRNGEKAMLELSSCIVYSFSSEKAIKRDFTITSCMQQGVDQWRMKR